jgi:hypothetical protein
MKILSDDLFLCQVEKSGIGWTNFAAVAMETKKGGFIFFLIPFIKLHETL